MTRPFRRLIGFVLALTLFGREFGVAFLDIGFFHGASEVTAPAGLHLDSDGGCHLGRCALGSIGTASRLTVLWFDSTIVPFPTTTVAAAPEIVTVVVHPFDLLPPSRSPPSFSLI